MNIFRIMLISGLLFGFTSGFAQMTVRTSNPSKIFAPGEQMHFIVNTNGWGQATYKIEYHKFAPAIQTGTIMLTPNTDAWISFTLQDTGFVHCTVELWGQSAKTSAAFAPYEMAPFEEIPQNYEAFWAEQKAELGAIPIDAQVWLRESREYSKTYNLNLGNIDGRRVYGYVSIPEGEGPFPAVLTVPSAGSHANAIQPEYYYAERNNAISVTISIHNNPIEQQAYNAYQHEAMNDPEGNYFRYGILGAMRAIDYIYSRPDFDQEHLAVSGVSQGGGLSIIVAGLDDRVDLLMSGSPALCEHAGLVHGRALGWPGFYLQAGWQGGDEQFQLETVAASKYYDAVYAARFFDGPAMMSISYNDDVVPPATSWAAFNELGSEQKLLVHALELGHHSPAHFWNLRFEFLRRYWPEATANPPSPWTLETTGYFADAGPDQYIQPGDTATLHGQVERNGTVNFSWPAKWKKLEGPGMVTFASDTARTTSATFSLPGHYLIGFAADDPYTFAVEQSIYTMMDAVRVIVGDSTIVQQAQHIDFYEISDKITTDPDFELEAIASSGLPVSFSVVSGPAIVNGSAVSLDGVPGTVTIKAMQAGNLYYLPAPETTRTFEVTGEIIIPPDDEECNTPTNLALNKPAAQSGTQHDAAADRAVDGNTDGNFWATFSVSNTQWVNNAWWEVDLGGVYQLEAINIWNRSDCCFDFVSDYHLLVSDESFVSSELAPTLAQAGIGHFYQEETAGFPTTVPVVRTGRYIRIQLAGQAFINLAEVEVMGCATSDINGRGSHKNEDKNQIAEFVLYPNPADNYIVLKVPGDPVTTSEFEIMDATGQVLKKGMVNGISKVDVDDLVPGVYFVIIKEKTGQIIRRFVKS